MWKDILKINMEEARRLGNTYSPDDMGKAVDVSIDSIFTDTSNELLKLINDGPVGDTINALWLEVHEVIKETRLRIRNHVLSPDWKPRKSSEPSPSTWYQD